MSEVLKVSPLGKTWIFDIDGTIVKHNGYKLDGYDTLLPGAREFWEGIPQEDMVILITARKDAARQATISFLQENGIRYDRIIFNAPYGERILINDRKPSGLNVSIAINTERDKFMTDRFEVDKTL